MCPETVQCHATTARRFDTIRNVFERPKMIVRIDGRYRIQRGFDATIDIRLLHVVRVAQKGPRMD